MGSMEGAGIPTLSRFLWLAHTPRPRSCTRRFQLGLGIATRPRPREVVSALSAAARLVPALGLSNLGELGHHRDVRVVDRFEDLIILNCSVQAERVPT